VNYRHHFHAGNFADVCKHVVLGRLVDAMARKEKGFLYLDTHAGRGRYDLSTASHGDSLARAPEWPDGVGRMFGRSDAPAAVQAYLERVRDFDRRSGHLGEGLHFYPGSPWLVKAALRPQDRMVLCELHPAEKAALAAEFHRVPRVSVLELDGYIAVRGQLPCPERRALVLLDPPFESPDEWRQLVDAVTTGVARMPGATFAIWYPVTQRARVDAFLAELERHPLPPTWCAEVTIAGEDAGLKMRGSGMVVVNPPWQLDLELGPVLAWLAQVLARAPGAEGRLTWRVRER
jgi:23S rRNA (adenine2030-N6)-methyltransferase